MLVAIEVDFEAVDEVEVEVADEVEVDVNLAGLGGSLIALIGTGFGSPILLKGSLFIKCLIGGGKYDFSEETVDNTEGVL